ncbi:hypothetical protein Vafri_6161, partial [Volvox africanus]
CICVCFTSQPRSPRERIRRTLKDDRCGVDSRQKLENYRHIFNNHIVFQVERSMSMPIPLRLRWLLPGYSFAPVLGIHAYDLLRAPSDLLFRFCGIRLASGILHPAGVDAAPSSSCHTSTSSAAGSSSCFEANTDARPPDAPAAVPPNSSSSPGGAPTRSSVSPPTSLEPHTATQSTGSQSMDPFYPVSGIFSSALTTNNPDLRVVGRDGIRDSHDNGGDSGGSGGGNGGDDGWHRLGGSSVRRQSRRQRPHQLETQDGKELKELAGKMRRLRESLQQVRDAAENEAVARHSGGGGIGEGGGDCDTIRGTGRSGSQLSGAVRRSAEVPALQRRRAVATGGAAATVVSGTMIPCGGASGDVSADHALLDAAIRGAAAAVERNGEGLGSVADVMNIIGTPVAGSIARNSDSDAGAATSPAETPFGVGVSDGTGGGSGGYVRFIQGGGGSLAAAAAANRDADLMRRILELQDLREAELLVYDAGSYFRSVHAGEMLVRLPELDLETSNSGLRTRRLIRFLSHCALRDLQPLPGPLLSRCVAAFARLSYAPPETVAPLAAALTAQSARKLRACSGTELANLAWGLACLEGLYGDIHQAVRQPAQAARLASGVRVVGYVRGRVEAGQEEGGAGEKREGRQRELELEGRRERQLDLQNTPLQHAAGLTSVSCTGEVRHLDEQCGLEGVEESVSTAGDLNDADHLAEGSSGTPATVAAAAAAEEEEVAAAKAAGAADGAVQSIDEYVPPVPRRKVPELVWLVPKAMDRIWERLARAAGARADQGKMQGDDLAKVAWAYARVGRPDKRLYDKLSAAALVLLEPFMEKARAAGVTGTPTYGRSRIHGASGGAAMLARNIPPPMDATAVTNLVWAFVSVGRRDPQLLGALAAVAASYKGMYDNDQVATLAQSYGQARYYHEPLCTAFGMVARRRHRHLTSSQLTALVRSLAELRHRDDELAGPVLGKLVWDKRPNLNAEQICDLMWACALLGLDIQRGATGSASGVLGLDPVIATAKAVQRPPQSASPSQSSSSSPRQREAAIGGRGGPAGGGSAAVVLASALQGHCDGLPPASLARALWALSLLLPSPGHAALRMELVSELGQELARHPVHSYSREALLQLYAAAHVLGSTLSQPTAVAAAEAAAAAAAVIPDVRVGRHDSKTCDGDAAQPMETASMYDILDEDSKFDEDAENEHRGMSAEVTAGTGREQQPASRVMWRDRARLFRKAATAATAHRMYGTDIAASAASTSATAGQQQERRQEQHLDQDTPNPQQPPPPPPPPPQDQRKDQVPLSLLSQLRQQHHGERRRGRGVTDIRPNPADGSWADVDWGRMRVAAPSVPAAAGAADGIHSVSPSHRHGARKAKHTTPKVAAAAAASADALPSSSYNVRRVYDEMSGRELWEVVPKGRGSGAIRDGNGDHGDDPAARVLPAALLSACRAAAAEWAVSERRQLEELEAEERELWRVDVAEALRYLTAAEPQLRWVTKDNTVLADLLLLPSPPSPPPWLSTSTAAATAPPPDPLAVLLVGDADFTRNPPFMPLGSVRMRQQLLEAAGARVLVVPFFLWRLMEDTPDDQICMLANLLGSQG